MKTSTFLPDNPGLFTCQTWCTVGNLFGNEVSVLRLSHPGEADQTCLKLQLVSVRTPISNLSETKSTSTPMLASATLSLPPDVEEDLTTNEQITVLSRLETFSSTSNSKSGAPEDIVIPLYLIKI